EERSYFKFDEPRASQPTATFPNAFNDPAQVNTDIDNVAAAISADVERRQNGTSAGTVPISQTPFERKLVVFGHADMCAPFWYNFSLAHRRNIALGTVMQTHPHGPELQASLLNTGRSGGFLPCADFNPNTGPNAHEQAAENAPTGFAN